MSIQVTSSAFQNNQPIPKKYTGEGPDVSPPLNWTGLPAGARELALICDDPDAPAGTWTHWVIWNLPASTHSLSQDVPRQEQLSDGARQGRNSFGKVGYNGPCPPAGQTHRYFFRVYALDSKLDVAPGADRSQVETAMQGHVLAHGEYMGTFHK